MPGTTIRDVAQDSGVSICSVSRILNNTDGFSFGEQTQQRVRESAARLGYRAHAAASVLRGKRTHLIGIISASYRGSHNTQKIDALTKALGNHPPYQPFFVDLKALQDDTGIHRTFGFDLLEGLFWSRPLRENKLLRALLTQPGKKPQVVTMGSDYPDDLSVSRVIVGIEEAAFEATSHLISLGHSRIAILHRDPRESDARFQGYQRAHEENGLSIDDRLCFPLPIATEPRSYYQAGQTWTERVLAGPHRPTAIMCRNDEVAIGAISGAYRMNLTVPGDVSIMGFDGGPASDFSVPALTTVELPIEAMATAAVELMIQRIEDGPICGDEQREFGCAIRVGESCAPPRKEARRLRT